MGREAQFHGTPEDQIRLLKSISHNCACNIVDQRITSVCESHKALVDDQRFLDGLLYSRYMRTQLIIEEGIRKP